MLGDSNDRLHPLIQRRYLPLAGLRGPPVPSSRPPPSPPLTPRRASRPAIPRSVEHHQSILDVPVKCHAVVLTKNQARPESGSKFAALIFYPHRPKLRPRPRAPRRNYFWRSGGSSLPRSLSGPLPLAQYFSPPQPKANQRLATRLRQWPKILVEISHRVHIQTITHGLGENHLRLTPYDLRLASPLFDNLTFAHTTRGGIRFCEDNPYAVGNRSGARALARASALSVRASQKLASTKFSPCPPHPESSPPSPY